MDFLDLDARLTCIRNEPAELEKFITGLPQQCMSVADSAGCTVVHRAITHYGMAAFKIMVRHWGAECLALKDSLGITAVHRAAQFLDEQAMQTFKFAAEGIQTSHTHKKYSAAQVFHQRCNDRKTVFHFAAMNENTNSVLKWLVEDQGPDCLSLRDDDDNTPVHISAMYQTADSMRFVKSKVGAEVFVLESFHKWTVFHAAARNSETNSALKWLVEDQGPECLTLKDDQDNTPVHLSAKHQTADSMRFLESKVVADIFTWKGFHSRTVFHQAALNPYTNSVLKWLVENWNQGEEPNALGLRDDSNASIIHYAALNQDEESLSLIERKLGTASLSSLGHLNKPSICYAACNEITASTVEFILKKLGPNCLLQTDVKERNFFHFCAFNWNLGEQFLERAVQALKLESEAAALNNFVDSWGRTPMHYACLMKNFGFIGKFLPLLDDKNVVDADGNNLLHSLFQTFPDYGYVHFYAPELASRAFDLVQSGVQLDAENSERLTCLMAAEVDEWDLRGLIGSLLQKFSHTDVERLLTNSDGLHAIHVFSGRHSLQILIPCLVEASGKSEDQLLHLQVRSGPRKGAKCLHFACEAGNKENIEFLIGKKLLLSDETHDGQSCLDFACNRGMWDVTMEVALKSGVTCKYLLCLIDPPHRALKLPNRSCAHSIISSFSDAKISPSDDKDDRPKTFIDEKNDDESPGVQVLLRSVELDSPDMLRSLLTLRISVTDSSKYVVSLLKKRVTEGDCRTLGHLPGADRFVKKFANESDGILEFALYYDRVNILRDLAVLEQFDLIPFCIRLLILLKGKVENKIGKHEQLSELQNAVFDVVINAIDSLYDNADEPKKKLMFRYLAAEFDGGPKFELRRQNLDDNGEDKKWYSVAEMLRIVDSDKVFATDALSHFVNEKWSERAALPWETKERSHVRRQSKSSGNRERESKKGEQNESDGSCSCTAPQSCYTYKMKFAVHLASLTLFLLHCSWFFTNFTGSRMPDVIMCGFAMSFTMQEVNDYLHTRERVHVQFLRRGWRVPMYFADPLNWLDLTALTSMWVGLTWKWFVPTSSDSAVYVRRIVLVTAFLLWGIRLVSLLSFFKTIGAKVSMLKKLVMKDLFAVLVLLVVVVYLSGMAFFKMLHNSMPHPKSENGTADISMRPNEQAEDLWLLSVKLLFGLYEYGDLQPCNLSLPHWSWKNCVHPVGLQMFRSFFLFAFLLLPPIVLINMLIALFSLTVSQMESRAEVIWRRTVFNLWRQFSVMSFLPPPVSFVEYSLVGAWYLCQKLRQKLRKQCELEQKPSWWQHNNWDELPHDFKEFLKFQSLQLRHSRPKLLRKVEKHLDQLEATKAFTGNTVADSRDHIELKIEELGTDVLEMKDEVRQILKELKEVKQHMEAMTEQRQQQQPRQAW